MGWALGAHGEEWERPEAVGVLTAYKETPHVRICRTWGECDGVLGAPENVAKATSLAWQSRNTGALERRLQGEHLLFHGVT